MSDAGGIGRMFEQGLSNVKQGVKPVKQQVTGTYGIVTPISQDKSGDGLGRILEQNGATAQTAGQTRQQEQADVDGKYASQKTQDTQQIANIRGALDDLLQRMGEICQDRERRWEERNEVQEEEKHIEEIQFEQKKELPGGFKPGEETRSGRKG